MRNSNSHMVSRLWPTWPCRPRHIKRLGNTHALFLLIAAITVCRPTTFVQGSKIDEEPELAVEQLKQEAVLEVRFATLKQKYGIRDRRTLEIFFQLFDLWIMLYRLNKADAALAEVVPACEWRHDDLTIKAVQALAFTRWKQGLYRDALAGFHQMEGWTGKNAALSENIGHTYNAIGALAEAERYFQEALTLTHAQPKGFEGNEGGILLGLAGVQDRLGNFANSLPTAQKAYDFYKHRDIQRGWESSLTAKAAMQLSKVNMKLGSLDKAQKLAEEAIRLFEVTSGDDSPLCAGAYDRLGDVQILRGRVAEASKSFHKAYQLEAIKDAFDLMPILEIHNKLVDTHLKGDTLDRLGFRRYFGLVGDVTDRVKRDLKQDGNAGVYYKAAGELYVLGGDCNLGKPLLAEAVRLFAVETIVDTSGLIKACSDLIDYCDGTYTKQSEEHQNQQSVKGRKGRRKSGSLAQRSETEL